MAEPSRATSRISGLAMAAALLGVLGLVGTEILFRHVRELLRMDDPYGARRLVLIAAAVVETFLFAPALLALTPERFKIRRFSLAMLPVCAVLLAWFVFHFGNHQFGAWDYSIVIDTGWRQILGQRPYVDFITPNPPLFNIGIELGFKLFGISWDAQLATIIASCIGTFFWIFWLLRRLTVSPHVSIFLASSVETVTVLAVCFWWYNDTSELAAVVFLLSALACAKEEETSWRSVSGLAVWCSFALALGLLLLAKPNIAGLMIGTMVPLLLIAAAQRLKAVVATVAGFAVAGAIALLGRVSLPAMLASYRAVAIERGGLHFFAIKDWTPHQKDLLVGWVVLMASPLLWLLPLMWRAAARRQWRDLAFQVALILPAPIALYCMATNAEAKESETAILLVSLGVACFVLKAAPWWMRRFFVGMTLGAVLVSLYLGVSRARIFGIGQDLFFNNVGADHRLSDPFFKHLRTTARMVEVQSEVHQAVSAFPGKTFLGPRLEYDYAVLRIPSPRGWPIYYQPGTSFARRDLPKVDAVWSEQGFQTLIFLHRDRVFYPADLLKVIQEGYQQQPGFSQLDVYTKRQ